MPNPMMMAVPITAIAAPTMSATIGRCLSTSQSQPKGRRYVDPTMRAYARPANPANSDDAREGEMAEAYQAHDTEWRNSEMRSASPRPQSSMSLVVESAGTNGRFRWIWRQ